MDTVYQWLMAHQLLVTIVSSIICLAIPNTVFVKTGFFISQFVRKVAGKKLEEKVEKIVDGFEEGLHSDDAGENK